MKIGVPKETAEGERRVALVPDVVKALTEKLGKFDRKAFAAAMKNACFTAKQYPGVLMDLCFDDKGDIDRESFMVEVKGGQQIVVETLPPLMKK